MIKPMSVILLYAVLMEGYKAHCPSKHQFVKEANLKDVTELETLSDTLDNIHSVQVNIAHLLNNEAQARSFCHALFNSKHDVNLEHFLKENPKEKKIFEEI